MSVSISRLYAAYAAVEEFPQEVQRADAAAAAAASTAARAESTARTALVRTHTTRVEDAQRQAATDVERLELRLRKIAARASAKGVIPAESVAATGALDFDSTSATNDRLDALLSQQSRLERGLRDLENQLALETDAARSRRNDRVTLGVAVGAALIAAFFGANMAGAMVAAIAMIVIVRRLGGSPSAFMTRRTIAQPLIAHDRRVRSGQTGVVGAAFLLVALLLALGGSVLISTGMLPAVFQLPGLLPASSPVTAVMSIIVFWAGVVFGAIMLTVAAKRLKGL